MGEFDRAQHPSSASVIHGVQSQAAGANRIRGSVMIAFRLAGGGQMATGSAAIAVTCLRRAGAAWGIGLTLGEMAASVYRAMTIQRRMVADLAASHTFASWVFAHRQAPTPHALPNSLRILSEVEDAAGNRNVITTEVFAQDWRTGVMETRSALNRSLRSVNLDKLTAELRNRMGHRAQLHTMPRNERLSLMRVMMAGDFNNSPQIAATVFQMSRMSDYGATARGVAAHLMQHHPYRPFS